MCDLSKHDIFIVQVVNAPMVLTKFLYLKHLTILISERTFSPPYNYVSLVYFFDASPSLETFFLDVPHEDVKHESVFWRFLTFGGAA